MINLKDSIIKHKKIIIKILLLLVCSIILGIVTECFLYEKIINIWNSNIDYDYWKIYNQDLSISKTRILILFLVYAFIGLHFIVDVKKMYLKICDNRYKIAIVLLIGLTLLELNGSSMARYDIFISPEENLEQRNILGVSRGLRTDEYSTQSTYILSQETNDYNFISKRLRGADTDMFTLVNAPVKDALMLGRPFQIGFLFLNVDMAFSLYWYARIILMFLVTFEIMMILSNKNKLLSLVGTILISFSSAVQWWYCMDTLIWGEAILVLLNLFLTTKKRSIKILCGIGEIISVLSYIFILYPAWQISFAYILLVLSIYIIYKNIKENNIKLDVVDVSIICIALIVIYVLLGLWLIKSNTAIEATRNTDYPGERISTGGGEKSLLGYFYNMYMPYEKFSIEEDVKVPKRTAFTIENYENQCENAGLLSFYPLPMIMALIYLIKTKKKDIFLILSLIVSGFLSIYCIIGLPEILAKISLLSMSMGNRAAIPLSTLNIFMFIYLISKIEEQEKFKFFENKIYPLIISIVMTFICIFLDGNNYLKIWEFLLSIAIFAVLFYLIWHIEDKKRRNIFLGMAIAITLIGGITVNPILKGVDVIKKGNFSNMLKRYQESYPDSLWLTNELPGISNYMVANGINVLSSTNVYPNKEMYEALFENSVYEEEIKKVWNRYHHLETSIYDGPTKIELLHEDSILLKLNYKDLNKIGVNFIVTRINLQIERPYINVQILEVVDNFIVYKVLDQEEEKNTVAALKEYKKELPNANWFIDTMFEKDLEYTKKANLKTIVTEELDMSKEVSREILQVDEIKNEDNVSEEVLPVINKIEDKYKENFTLMLYDGKTTIEEKEEDNKKITIIKVNYKELENLGIDYIITKRNLKIECPYINLEEEKIISDKYIIYKVIND